MVREDILACVRSDLGGDANNFCRPELDRDAITARLTAGMDTATASVLKNLEHSNLLIGLKPHMDTALAGWGTVTLSNYRFPWRVPLKSIWTSPFPLCQNRTKPFWGSIINENHLCWPTETAFPVQKKKPFRKFRNGFFLSVLQLLYGVIDRQRKHNGRQRPHGVVGNAGPQKRGQQCQPDRPQAA